MSKISIILSNGEDFVSVEDTKKNAKRLKISKNYGNQELEYTYRQNANFDATVKIIFLQKS